MRNLITLLLGILLLVAVSFGMSHLSGIGTHTPQANKAPQATQNPDDLGVITEKQKEHSKLYKDYKTGKKLRDLTIEIGDVTLKRKVGLYGGDPSAAPYNFQTFLQDQARNAEAVIVGRVTVSTPQLTEDEDYIFTDYDLVVEEVLKDNPAAPIQTNSNLTLTRPGGLVRLNAHIVEAIDESFQP